MDPDAPAVVVVETPPSEQQEVATAEAAVEIAQIAAERDIAIAEINAETTATIVEAGAEQDDEDIEWLRGELADLRGQCETLRAELSNTQAMLTETNLRLDQMTETMAAQAAALTLLSPPQPSEPEPGPEPPAEPPAPEQSGTLRKRRWM